MSTVVGNLSVELGISDDQLRAGLASAMVQAQKAGQQISNSVNQAGAKSGGNPQGLLNLSRAVDDLQYGFRGVINNIEGIVTGFGGSAGLAGAATLAGIAIASIVPKLAELAAQTDPVKELSQTLKDINNSGAGGTFLGMSEAAKATKAAYEAAAEKLKEMQSISSQVVFAGGGPGMGAAGAVQDVGTSAAELARQRRALGNLAQDAARMGFMSEQAQRRIVASGLSEFDLTTNQKDQQQLNQQIFQAAIDKFGGGQALQKRLDFLSPDMGLFGAFKEGDIAGSNEAIKLLGLQAEQVKILAADFERVTGSAAELKSIDEQAKQQLERDIDDIYKGIVEAADKNIKLAREKNQTIGQEIDQMVKDELERQRLQAQASKIQNNIDESMLQRQRTEIIGASDVFQRNFGAGTSEDPTVKAIEKQTEDLREIMQQIKELN